MDEMEGLVEYINASEGKFDAEIDPAIQALKKNVEHLHATLDEFLYKLAMERMQPAVLRRF